MKISNDANTSFVYKYNKRSGFFQYLSPKSKNFFTLLAKKRMYAVFFAAYIRLLSHYVFYRRTSCFILGVI